MLKKHQLLSPLNDTSQTKHELVVSQTVSPTSKIVSNQKTIPGFHGMRGTSQNYNQKSTSFIKDMTLHSIIKNDSINQGADLQNTVQINRILQKRIRGVQELTISLQKIIQDQALNNETDVAKLYKTVQDLSEGLQRASQSEVELGFRRRDLVKGNSELIDLQQQYQTIKLKSCELEDMNERLHKKVEDLQQQNKQNQHNLLVERRLNSDLQHKISCLEQRLELVLDSDFAGSGSGGTQIHQGEQNQDKLRRTLTELVKECEGYKRDIQNKNKDIERLTDSSKSSQLRVQKLTQKIEIMKKKISLRDLENLNNEEKNTRQQTKEVQQDDTSLKNDPTTILVKNELYDSLDFRINSLRSEYAELIHDIQEQGSGVFSQKVASMTNQKQMREQISLITSQYLSFKDSAEKLNMILKLSLQLQGIKDLHEQMNFIANNFRQIFMSERCNLWILDAQNGIIYTFNDQNEQVRALMNRGIFAEVIRYQKPLHKRDGAIKALYFETSLGKFQVKSPQGALIRANQTLCYPIFNMNRQIAGQQLLEISNSFADYFSFDEEYYGVILSKICERIVNKHLKEKLLETTISFDSLIMQAFWDLNSATSLKELYRITRNWYSKILTISQMALYFIDQTKKELFTFTTSGSTWDGATQTHLTTMGETYVGQGEKVTFSWSQGLAGQVRERKKSLIVLNIKKSFEYDQNVDIDSLLPVLILPIIIKSKSPEEDDQVVGIVEIPLKQRFLVKTSKDSVLLGSSCIVGQDQSFEYVAQRLTECLSSSYGLVRNRSKESMF